MTVGKSRAIFCNEDIIEIKKEDMARLKKEALKSSTRRARLCLHKSHDDKVHEMVIAFCRDSYTQPHRHLKKSESFHIIEGEMEVLLFDNEGKVIRRIKMGPVGSSLTFFYRLSINLWHTVIPLTEFVIIHETTSGPFIERQNEFADWSPKSLY